MINKAFSGVLIFLLFEILSILSAVVCHAQSTGVGINANGAPADPSAILDASSHTQGLLIPRMTTAERNAISLPAVALLIFNTTTNCFETYVNGTWNTIWCYGGCPPPAAPTAGTNTPSATQIVWNWNTVSGATGYQWNTSNNYPGVGINVVASPTYTQNGLTCNTAYTLYVWAYNACGHSSYVTLTQTTSTCVTCFLDLQVIANADNVTRWDPGFNAMANLLAGNDGAQTISSAMRFTNVTIPQGAIITAAYMSLYTEPVNNPGTAITVNTNIYAENSDNATQITSNADYDSRVLTAAVAWNSIPPWSVNSQYNSPSIVSAVQTVVNRSGWTSGNAINIFWKDNASSVGAWRRCYSYNYSPVKAPKIHIEYNCP